MQFIQNLFQQIIGRISGFFSPKPDEPEFTFDREPFSSPPVTERKKGRRKRANAVSKKTLAELLDNLDRTFKAMTLPRDSWSWLPKKDIAGLKRLGVYVPDNWKKELSDDCPEPVVDVTRTFPAIMAISFTWDHERNEDGASLPNSMFAIKITKLPYFAAALPGVAYMFGYSYKFDNKNFWSRCYLVIDSETGLITPCDELFVKTHTIPVKRARKRDGATKQYVTRQWKEPELMIADEFGSVEQRKRAARQGFGAMIKWWRDRELRWSVGVRKGNDRVTFSVSPENTKTYFADRDKSVKAADGTAKKIIHYVRQHERVRNGKTITVREHIRGIREFDWGSHHCIVTAPKFHGAMLATDYDLPALGDEDMDKYKGKLADLTKVGAMLADLEERDIRAKK